MRERYDLMFSSQCSCSEIQFHAVCQAVMLRCRYRCTHCLHIHAHMLTAALQKQSDPGLVFCAGAAALQWLASTSSSSSTDSQTSSVLARLETSGTDCHLHACYGHSSVWGKLAVSIPLSTPSRSLACACIYTLPCAHATCA